MSRDRFPQNPLLSCHHTATPRQAYLVAFLLCLWWSATVWTEQVELPFSQLLRGAAAGASGGGGAGGAGGAPRPARLGCQVAMRVVLGVIVATALVLLPRVQPYVQQARDLSPTSRRPLADLSPTSRLHLAYISAALALILPSVLLRSRAISPELASSPELPCISAHGQERTPAPPREHEFVAPPTSLRGGAGLVVDSRYLAEDDCAAWQGGGMSSGAMAALLDARQGPWRFEEAQAISPHLPRASPPGPVSMDNLLSASHLMHLFCCASASHHLDGLAPCLRRCVRRGRSHWRGAGSRRAAAAASRATYAAPSP